DADEGRHHLRLLLEKFLLDLRLVVEQPVIALPRRDERRKGFGVAELERERRVRGPLESIHDLVRVAPDLRIEAAAAGIENADDAPDAAGEFDAGAEARVGKAPRDRAADDDLARATAEKPPVDQPQVRPQLERRRIDAAHGDVAHAAGKLLHVDD